MSDYRRKHVELYSGHELFRYNNLEATEVRKKSAMEAMDDARNYLLQGGQLAVSPRAASNSTPTCAGRADTGRQANSPGVMTQAGSLAPRGAVKGRPIVSYRSRNRSQFRRGRQA